MTTYYDKRCVSKPWFACYQENGKRVNIGSFKTKQEAHNAHAELMFQRSMPLRTDGPMPESIALKQSAPRKSLAFGEIQK
jgi:hypothetical protein